MLTTVEKVMLLREVDIFSQVSTEELAYLAAILEEQRCTAGQRVYQQQDPADAMYLVVSGQVRVHREQLEITVAGQGEAFGTWALFDEEPRLSAATATEEALLLRLDKEDFIDLLADNVEITQGVLKALVKRMRGLIGQVA